MKSTFSLLVLSLFSLLSGAAFGRGADTFRFAGNLSLGHSANFTNVKVIDRRGGDLQMLGTYIYNIVPKDIFVANSFEKELTDFGNELIGGSKADGSTLLVVLNDLKIFPITKMAVMHERASFFRGTNGSYHFLFTTDSLYETYEGRASEFYNKKNDPIWWQQLQLAWYQQFDVASVANESVADTRSYTIDEAAKRDELVRQQYPIYSKSVIPAGVYRTREDFLNLNPGIANYTKWDNADGTVAAFFKVDEKGKKAERFLPNEYYAVWTGKRWYKSCLSGPRQMHLQDGDFYFTGALDGLKGLQTNDLGGEGLLTIITNESRRKNQPKAIIMYVIKLDAETGRYLPVARLGNP